MSYDDDDLNAPLATDTLEDLDGPARDERGRFAKQDEEAPDDESQANADSVAADSDAAAAGDVPPEVETEDGLPPETVPDAPAEPDPVAPEPTPEEKEKAERLAKQKVPYARFKEAVEKERKQREALEQELAVLRERVSASPTVDIGEDELNALGDLLIEGKTQDYAKGMKGILEKVFQKGVETATERARDVTRIESAEERVSRERQEAAARWQTEYPEFDPQSEAFDADLLDEAIALRDAYEARGFSPAAAIERAVKRLAGERSAPEPAPAPAPPAPKRESTVPKKIAAAAAQPPLPKVSGELDKPVSLLSKIADMTDEEFDSLSDAQLERLRRGESL